MSETKVIDLSQVKLDDMNFNRHNADGMKLLEKSISSNRFGRSILLDKDNNVIAGNGVVETSRKLGTKSVRIIETDGNELIAVKRTDLALDSKEGRELALADNSVANVNLEWDTDELQKAADEWEIVPEEWGVEMPESWVSGKSDGQTSADADARDNKERTIHQRDPDSEIIVATVSLFGTTEDMMLTQTLSKEDADKLIALAKSEGADNLMKRIIASL